MSQSLGTVRCGHAILLPIFRAKLSCIHEWEGRQKIKQAHHTSVASDCVYTWMRGQAENQAGTSYISTKWLCGMLCFSIVSIGTYMAQNSRILIVISWTAPSHYLNQCWNIVNWAPRNKLQWTLNRNSYIFIQEHAFENVVRKTTAILSPPQCVTLNHIFHIQVYICSIHSMERQLQQATNNSQINAFIDAPLQ